MGAFNIGLSGLNASSKDLDVTGNNIANASTVGFKRSRAEFADVYATGAFGSSRTQSGNGVTVQAVTQQFNQGNLDFTDNTLDLAVSGQGFFVLKPNLASSDLIYTRAGAFQVNKDGYIVNSLGQMLQGFPVNGTDGSVTTTALASVGPISLPQITGVPQATSSVGISVNVDSRASALVDASGNPINTSAADASGNLNVNDSRTYTSSTSVNVYDSLGNIHTVTYYFVKGGAADSSGNIDASGNHTVWYVVPRIDGYPDSSGNTLPATSSLTVTAGQIIFGPTGSLVSETQPALNWAGLPGADTLSFTTTFDADVSNGLPGSTQYAQSFSLLNMSQDGFAPGRLSGLDITDTGIIRANYSNGTSEAIAKVAMANFYNSQGLKQLGDTNWQETINSGAALAGEAGSGNFGFIKSATLESSNVDLTKELVHLIVAQRNFQANAKTIETANQVTQTVINLR